MSLKEDFQKAAQEVVYEFAKDIGKSTFKSFLDSSYDSETGVVNTTFVDPSEEVYIAFSNVETEDFKVRASASEEPSIPQTSRVANIAGIDLIAVPKKLDEIVAADDGNTYIVTTVKTDMYQAAYKCVIDLVIPEEE